MLSIYDSLIQTLNGYEWIGFWVAKVSVGLLFLLSGWAKLFVPSRRAKMLETISAAKIPFPKVNAFVASMIEAVGGFCLIVGIFTPIFAMLLIFVMCVALFTTVLPSIKAGNFVDWLGEFLYLPETLFVVILFWVALRGV